VTMTGLDQEMMQKNISVKNLKDSQKNILTFSIILLIVNFLFLLMGGLLYLYGSSKGIQVPADDLFPTIALNYMPAAVSIIFVIGLVSALFPSADGALTALTSSFCIDMLGIKRRNDWDEKTQKRKRLIVHLVFTIIFFLMVIVFKVINDKSIIDFILRLAGYTYGPLLGLFAFGILTKRKLNDGIWVVIVCLLSPLLSYLIFTFSEDIFGGYQIGIELLVINGLLTFLGLLLLSQKRETTQLAGNI
ncbi:MAG TPA: sodium:solute symporter, partial [Chitinophagaceae bacterium]|nr:sodium:solute symporter [Chitinophagaceae bacterium]